MKCDILYNKYHDPSSLTKFLQRIHPSPVPCVTGTVSFSGEGPLIHKPIPDGEQLLACCLQLPMQLTVTIHSLEPFPPPATDSTMCCGGKRLLFAHLFCFW